MSFIPRSASSPLTASSRRDLIIAAAAAAAGVGFVMTDCVLYQLATGGPDLWLAFRWFAGSVAPWVAAFLLLRMRVALHGGRPSLAEAVLLAATFAASSLLDVALIPPADVADLMERLEARLPLGVMAALAARLRLDFAARPRPFPPPDRRLADARVITAAGNYVEVEGIAGRRLLRLTLADAAARIEPGRMLQIHRSTLVARELVVGLERDRNGVAAVRLADGRRLKVGPSFRAQVRQALEP